MAHGRSWLYTSVTVAIVIYHTRKLNLAVESQIAITNVLARFKFGSPVQDCHMYIICEEESLANFNLAVGRSTAKPPNLNCRQLFRLYGTFGTSV